MNYQKLLDEIKSICIEQGEILREAFLSPEDVEFEIKDNQEDKGWTDRDLTTKLDSMIEEVFYERLSKEFPELGFNLEENAGLNDDTKEFTCFIDPIDGTKYFARGVPIFAMAVGVTKGKDSVLGATYNPLTKRFYAGAEGIPTTMNGKLVRVSDVEELDRAILSLDMASRKENWEAEKDWMNRKIVELNLRAGRIRLFGNGALPTAWTASGGIDGFISIWGHGSKPFDIAAGKALIKYAGGKTIDLEVPGLSVPRFVGANEKIANQIIEILLK